MFFPVALGDHNGNHDLIRKKLLDDLNTLTQNIQRYYVPSFGKVVNLKFFIAYSIQDHVEHCDFTGFSAHNGICSTVPSLSCPIRINDDNSSPSAVSLLKPIQSCLSCFQRRFLLFSESYYSQAKDCNNDSNEC